MTTEAKLAEAGLVDPQPATRNVSHTLRKMAARAPMVGLNADGDFMMGWLENRDESGRSLLRMRPLPGGQILVQLGHVLEHGDPGQGLDDLKHFLDLRLHVDKRGLPAAFFQSLARGGKNP